MTIGKLIVICVMLVAAIVVTFLARTLQVVFLDGVTVGMFGSMSMLMIVHMIEEWIKERRNK